MRFLLALFLFAACMANADEFRPAYLEIRPAGAETYDVLWTRPGGWASLNWSSSRQKEIT